MNTWRKFGRLEGGRFKPFTHWDKPEYADLLAAVRRDLGEDGYEDLTVAEVLEKLESGEFTAEYVRERETATKNRKTVLAEV